ncbi:MAG: adenosylcobalamin-dependent ribonucleoside-diphosphate reductase [Gracilimonas sp.]|uniref:adenosylcobalamin-dependent ribonucleoside-diphosphate reductase n=1 Tax=Gracilimonas sp. TaxID=1974203 RepID=UPI001995FCDD|nr:adenosylcobalamin-dependent ribonucleoside-diphosphate reductase [Gracilimonas sp.]MBD3616303.1 adenosylcobalamin-dependent ribonucleoside-diphosphate reductase [Gracilimonas sp.]
MNFHGLQNSLSRQIWDRKYRLKSNTILSEESIEDTWLRVANALAYAEENEHSNWAKVFYQALKDFKFIPAGRILAGAGTGHKVTLFNCFVMGTIEDSIPSIFENLKESALTMQKGGGIGCDFSCLRPKGSLAKSSNNISSGPVSFMKIWDSMCSTMLSTGSRRGAMMATLRCDHPDIFEFIHAKSKPGELTNFNLSVLVTDELIKAVINNDDWPLVFPSNEISEPDMPQLSTLKKRWSNTKTPVSCMVFKVLKARDLWDELMKANYHSAEPGVLFIDRINKMNNLSYCEYITATNPCGEVPLPPYGACDLGSINLTQFIEQPFTDKAKIQSESLKVTTETAVRMLDNVISISEFPLDQQRGKAQQTRRVGLGITGLADALIMLKLHYGSEEARLMTGNIMKLIAQTAYQTSIELAKEKGAFPLFDKQRYLQSRFIKKLPANLRKGIEIKGIRNSHLLSIAPTGSISLLAGNVSSGIEPVFDFSYRRKVLDYEGNSVSHTVTDFAYLKWIMEKEPQEYLPEYFVTVRQLSPKDHLKMQAVVQQYVDNSISKTINIPEDYSFQDFKNVYELAHELKLKGCTTFRPNWVTGSVLEHGNEKTNIHCCTPDREAD